MNKTIKIRNIKNIKSCRGRLIGMALALRASPFWDCGFESHPRRKERLKLMNKKLKN